MAAGPVTTKQDASAFEYVANHPEYGLVRVTVEVLIPQEEGPAKGQKFTSQEVFPAYQVNWLRDMVDLHLGRVGSYIRRNWTEYIEPLLPMRSEP